MKILALLVFAFALTGCKTFDQVMKTAHDILDVAGKVAEDVSDGIDAAKQLVNPPAPAVPSSTP